MIDPNKMTPKQAAETLNADEGQIRHLLKTASIAGDAKGRTVSLLKLLSWLIDNRDRTARPAAGKKKLKAVRTYEEIKEAARKRAADASLAGRDIGEIPAVVDPERKKRCRRNLKKFLETYFPQKFYMGWSQDHKKVIGKIQTSVLKGGLFALAMPRSTGKTTICERAAIWACFYGHRKFVELIGATEDAALANLDEIKLEIECNELLMQDFPEICYPIRKLEGIANRCNGQTCMGVRTRITWTDGEIVLPTITGAISSGTVIQGRGITGRLRGIKAAVATGESRRPDLVLIDDPQTDESAASPEQNRKRLRILSGAILGLAGPGVKISGVMPCTVIRPGDMADEILNKEKHPEWNGERCKLLISFPKNMDLWQKYAEIWADSLREDGSIAAATAFYLEHRSEMDDGACVSWPERHEPDEASGIQYAMDLFFRDRDTFFSEYQNEPISEDEGETEKITVENVWARMNHRRRGDIPAEAEHITVFIDVQGKLLYWLAAAFADDFTGWVIDYGAYPDQKRRYFALKDAQPTFRQLYPTAGLEGAIYSALADLTGDILARKWIREDGAEMYVERCVIDSAWGDSTKTVYRFCKESPFARILLPSKGRGISAAQRPFSEYRREPGVKLGFNWRIFRIRGQISARLFEYDTNFWKSFFRSRLFTTAGDPGCLTIFGSDAEQHRLIAEHWSAEVSTPTQGGGRRVDAWKLIPGRENHWLDGIVGCMAAASTLGCEIDFGRKKEEQKAPPIPIPAAVQIPRKIVPGKRILPHR